MNSLKHAISYVVGDNVEEAYQRIVTEYPQLASKIYEVDKVNFLNSSLCAVHDKAHEGYTFDVLEADFVLLAIFGNAFNIELNYGGSEYMQYHDELVAIVNSL